jgi:putative endonuclease
MPSGFCYIMTNRARGVLYVGSTTNLPRRAYEHRMGLLDGFTSRYGVTQLVHYEEYPLFMDAVRRERAIKHWSRAWKIELVEKNNPEWTDLYDHLLWKRITGSSPVKVKKETSSMQTPNIHLARA